MMRPRLIVVALLVVSAFGSVAFAQNKYWREVKGKPLVMFDWNCASPATLPSASLKKLIDAALAGESLGPTENSADRAIAYDLNGDGKPEYFVPLNCGATGNCNYGVFSLKPKARFLGKVNGEYLYLHARRGGWPTFITYGHFNSAEGDLTTYTFRKGRYRATGKSLHTDARGGEFGEKVPAFLDRARKGCAALGN